MTPLPKRRHSTRRGGKRKASIALELPSVTKGKGEEPLHTSHRAYVKEGFYYYKGVKIAKA